MITREIYGRCNPPPNHDRPEGAILATERNRHERRSLQALRGVLGPVKAKRKMGGQPFGGSGRPPWGVWQC